MKSKKSNKRGCEKYEKYEKYERKKRSKSKRSKTMKKEMKSFKKQKRGGFKNHESLTIFINFLSSQNKNECSSSKFQKNLKFSIIYLINILFLIRL